MYLQNKPEQEETVCAEVTTGAEDKDKGTEGER